MAARLSLRQREHIGKEWHFDPDQPRDYHGRFGSGGGPAHTLHDVIARHPKVEIHAHEDAHGVHLSLIRVAPENRGGGKASAALQDVTDYADAANKPVALTPDPLGSGGLSKTALTRWYSSHGFVPNHGRHKDFRFTESMIRHPEGVAKSAPRLTLRKRGYPQLVRAHVRGATIPSEVQAEVGHYLTKRPDIRACEAAEHGYDPAQDIPRYLAQELAEPEHASVRSGPLTMDSIRQWEEQEDAEHADDGHVAKEQPAASDVHVDTATDIVAKPKKRRKKGDEVDANLSVLKADDEQRVVYGIVLEPDVEDSQGDIVSKEDVEQAAHRFLYDGARIGDQHKRLAPDTVRPVENYIAPVDFEMGGQIVKAGSWVLAVHVPDDGLWEQVRKGDKGAFSVAGTGVRSPL